MTRYADAREIATICWVAVLAIMAVALPRSRGHVVDVLKQLGNWKLWLPLGIYALCLICLVYVGYHLGLWTWSLLAATVIWFFVSGLKSLWGAVTEATKSRRHFRRHLAELVSLAVFLEFFINLRPLPFLAELVLVPFIAFVALVQGALPGIVRSSRGPRIASGVLICIAVGLLVWSVLGMVDDPIFDAGDVLRQFILPFWLSILTLPIIFMAAMAASYELLFTRLRFFTKANLPLAARIGLLANLRGNFYEIGRFAGQRTRPSAPIGTCSQARREVAGYKAEQARQDARRQAARQKLMDMAGVVGTDDAGRELDRRDFLATKESLLYLHMCMMGHYREANRYRSDLLSVMGNFEQKGLSEPHGIELRVRQDGQAWFAYRKTPSGFCFGVGARGAPGSQWVYSGRPRPSGFPSDRGGWADYLSTTPLEWMSEPSTL